jgi:hypothetical protein
MNPKCYSTIFINRPFYSKFELFSYTCTTPNNARQKKKRLNKFKKRSSSMYIYIIYKKQWQKTFDISLNGEKISWIQQEKSKLKDNTWK